MHNINEILTNVGLVKEGSIIRVEDSEGLMLEGLVVAVNVDKATVVVSANQSGRTYLVPVSSIVEVIS